MLWHIQFYSIVPWTRRRITLSSDHLRLWKMICLDTSTPPTLRLYLAHICCYCFVWTDWTDGWLVCMSFISSSFFIQVALEARVWPDSAKFHHFVKMSKGFCNSFRVSFIFGIILNLLWLNFYDYIQIFIVENGRILKNNLAVWSHCSRLERALCNKWTHVECAR